MMLLRKSTNKKISYGFAIKAKGFTLIELVMVIVLLAVMSVGISSFMGLATQTYVNVSARDEIISTARFAIERLNREIRNAIPNSIRTRNDSTRQCIEFMPIVASSIYTDIPVAPEAPRLTISVIPFINTSGTAYSCSPTCFDYVTVYPLTSADIYTRTQNGTGKTFRLSPFLPPVNQTEWTMNLVKPLFATGVQFSADSPTNSLYISNLPISYCVNNGQLRRYYGHSPTTTQVLAPTGGYALMAENIASLNINDLPFDYQTATLQRNAVVKIKLDFVRDDEHIVFNHEIHLANTP